jgi:diphosphomevalonate decarboxylase
MMTSTPPYVLMEPNTLEIIKRVQAFRESGKVPVYFSLDAGPNIHLLYPDNVATEVKAFIESELLSLCENNQMIEDVVGEGPLEL